VVVTILQVQNENGFVRSFSLPTSDYNHLQLFLGVYSLLDWLGTGVLNSTSTAVTAGARKQLCDISAAARLQSSWISDVLSQHILSLTAYIYMLKHYTTTATINIITCCLSRVDWKGMGGFFLWSASVLDKPQTVYQ
jgi:hypothetical protein